MKRKIRYKPSKVSSAMGVVMGGLFVVVGLTTVIPDSFRTGILPVGLFGLLWTGVAVYIMWTNLMCFLGKGKGLFGSYEVEDIPEEDGPEKDRPSNAGEGHVPTLGPDIQTRLEQLESLNKAGMLTPEEYQEKRREILKSL